LTCALVKPFCVVSGCNGNIARGLRWASATLFTCNRLGFTVHRHYGTYQIDRQPIGAWIAHPPG
jgi:hypothetical protein